MRTPIRLAMKKDSRLLRSIQDGLGALAKAHRKHIAADVRALVADSLDIDTNLREGNEQASRWDYLLGLDLGSSVVALEPHSAYTSQVSTVIEKRRSARKQLAAHLRPGAQVSAWYWVASGKVDFVPHDKAMRRLDQEGITFVGAQLKKQHLLQPR